MLVVLVYAFCIPVVAMHLPGVGGVGAADLLMPFGLLSLLLLSRVKPVQLSHIALMAFMFASLLSLTMINQKRIALDCTIRWIRLISIVLPFYFGLFMPLSDNQLKRAFWAYGLGGCFAVVVGMLIYVLQIEIRSDQQKLWVDGGFELRAGGLIGNSGAFGHLTATWCVASIAALFALTKSRYQLLLAGIVMALTGYTIISASSRATMLHLIVGLGTFFLLFKTSANLRKQIAAFSLVGGLCLAVAVGGKQLMSSDSGGNAGSSALQTNLERFIPGWGGKSLDEFTSNRAGNWPEYIAMMSETWLLGTGYKTGVRMHEESPDNSYLSVMLETGIVGFTCMGLFVIGVLYRLGVLYLAGDKFAAVMIPVCAGQLTHCLTSDVYTFWITMPIVYLLLGCVILRPLKTVELAQ